MRSQEPIRQGLILAEEPEQKVFGLDIRAAELAGLIAREEDYPPGFFCIALKHITLLPLYERRERIAKKQPY